MSAITDWLTSIGACSPAISALASQPTLSAAYSSLTRPDWLLWFCFVQSTDATEKKRVLTALQTLLGPTVTTAVVNTPGAAPVAAALNDVTVFLHGALDPTVAQGHLAALMNTLVATPVARTAVACAMKLLQIAEASPGAVTASAGSDLAQQWVKLQQLLGTLPSDGTEQATCAAALRAAIPFNNLTGLP